MFYINYKFNVNSHLLVLNLKEDIKFNNINVLIISCQLNNIYSFSNSFKIKDFKDIEIYIYIDNE